MRLLLVCLIFSAVQAQAQRYLDRSGQAVFFSEAPVENIRAVNQQALAILDARSGEVAVSMLMKGFQFRKALMQEHFNESYVESDRFPKATFEGQIKAFDPSMLLKKTEVTVAGKLTIHGVTRPMETTVTLTPAGDAVNAEAIFPVRVADHDIEIPSVVIDNIAEVVEVTVRFQLKKQ